MNIVHIDELELIPVGDRGLQWRPDPHALRDPRLRDERVHG